MEVLIFHHARSNASQADSHPVSDLGEIVHRLLSWRNSFRRAPLHQNVYVDATNAHFNESFPSSVLFLFSLLAGGESLVRR